eukprot:TRINITY_DN738_c0_g1_i1.p2 TRINITY_DN738_c0_g1~~TRINITY_DN738_c0_g1_i1.p2  ORF type:complete len:115 (+),score=32.04 TRINITY_DN738_c0_g1_i1:102-446(+)
MRAGPYKRGNKTVHSVVRLFNDTEIYLQDSHYDGSDVKKTEGNNNTQLYLTCKDEKELKGVYDNCIHAGFKVILKLEKQFWGDVYAIVEDHDHIRWSMAVYSGMGTVEPGEVHM